METVASSVKMLDVWQARASIEEICLDDASGGLDMEQVLERCLIKIQQCCTIGELNLAYRMRFKKLS